MADGPDWRLLNQPIPQGAASAGIDKVGSALEAIMARREAKKRWEAEQAQQAEQLKLQQQRADQDMYLRVRDQEAREEQRKQQAEAAAEQIRIREEAADAKAWETHSKSLAAGIPDPVARRPVLERGIQFRPMQPDAMSLIGAPTEPTTQLPPVEDRRLAPMDNEEPGQMEADVAAARVTDPTMSRGPATAFDPMTAFAMRGRAQEEERIAAEKAKYAGREEVVDREGNVSPYFAPPTPEEKLGEWAASMKRLVPGKVMQIDKALTEMLALPPKDHAKAMGWFEQNFRADEAMDRTKARPRPVSAGTAGLDRDRKEGVVNAQLDSAVQQYLSTNQYRSFISDGDAIDELSTLTNGASKSPAFATLLRGRFARWGAGPGVLTESDISTFYTNLGGLAQKWGVKVEDMLTGTMPPERQKAIEDLIDTMKKRAAAREVRFGKGIEATLRGRPGADEHLPRMLETFTPGYWRQKQNKALAEKIAAKKGAKK